MRKSGWTEGARTSQFHPQSLSPRWHEEMSKWRGDKDLSEPTWIVEEMLSFASRSSWASIRQLMSWSGHDDPRLAVNKSVDEGEARAITCSSVTTPSKLSLAHLLEVIQLRVKGKN
jgi:hypothetical protein